jgi:hypothetical protein
MKRTVAAGSLVAGPWLLVAGPWLLVAGPWLSVLSQPISFSGPQRSPE